MLVLIVGGEAGLHQRLINHLQARRADHLITGDCEQAWQIALANPPQLILCAETAVWGNGHSLLHQVRNQPPLSSTPFVLLSTSEPDPGDREIFLAHGATAFMTVASDADTFWGAIDAALERIRVEKARRTELARNDEAAFLHNARQILGPGSGPEWEERQTQEERFRTMVESSPDWFWEFDKEANFTYVSPRIQDLLGYAPEEIVGQNAFDLMDPEEAERVHQHFDPLAQKFLPFTHLENINRHKDGHEVVIESSGIPTFDPDGQFTGYRGIDRDITERKLAERALRKSEGRLREAQEVARLGYYSYDVVEKRLERSEVFNEILGITADTPLDKDTWLASIHPDHREVMQTYLNITVLQNRQPFDRSYKIIRASNGQTRWVHGRGQLLTDEDGALVKISGTIQDITPQKMIEEQLVETLKEAHAARKQLKALFTSVADALVVTDTHQRVLLINQAAEQLLGKQLADVHFQPIGNLLNEPVLIDHLQALLSGEEVPPAIEFALSAATPDDAARTVQARVALVQDSQGEPTELIAVLRDITREREADRMKSEFISIAAHELRTPLTAVMGYAELLEQEQVLGAFTEHQRQEYLGTILQKCEQLRGIVDDLLSLGRIETGRSLSLDKKPCELISELKRIITTHGLEAAGHGYSMEFPDETVPVRCDLNKLEQVMDNLLSNAAKYSPGGAAITIRGERRDGVFRVHVSDRGIGMSPEQVARVFDKFYRANMQETAVGGLGLGMSISKSIIEGHGGKIWVESAPGEGTTVSFSIPIQNGSARHET